MERSHHDAPRPTHPCTTPYSLSNQAWFVEHQQAKLSGPPRTPPVDEPVGRTVVDEGVDPAEANANAVQTDDNPAVSKARR